MRMVDATQRHPFKHDWVTLIAAVMGRVSGEDTGLIFEDRSTRYDWYCHGPGQYILHGYRDRIDCVRAIGSRLRRLGSRLLGKIKRRAKREFKRMHLSSMWELKYAPKNTAADPEPGRYAPFLDQQTSSNSGRQLGPNEGRELSIFAAPVMVAEAVLTYGTTIVVTQAARAIGTTGKLHSATLLRFVGSAHPGNADYEIKSVASIGETLLEVTLTTGLRQPIAKGALVHVVRNRTRTAGDRVEEMVEKVYVCQCDENQRSHHRSSCKTKLISWPVFRQPAFSFRDDGSFAADSDMEVAKYGNYLTAHPNGCDCLFCNEVGPAFDSFGNPRPPSTFPAVRAARGSTVCSCGVPECMAVQSETGDPCTYGGLPCFHVTYFFDWTGSLLSGTNGSDDADDLRDLQERALAPPREPTTLSDLHPRHQRMEVSNSV